MAALEAAALNGELFNPHRSPSPARSFSTASEPNTDDELGSDLSLPSSPLPYAPLNAASRGGARTGPKGVINDRENQRHHDRLAQTAQRLQINENQKKQTMVGVTSLEEDDLREKERLLKESEDDALATEQWRANRRAELEKPKEVDVGREDYRGYRRGGLREVGKEGFLNAVEKRGWTVVLIYEPNIPRCNALLASTLSLALTLPNDSITLLRARASQLEFSLLPPSDPNDIDEEPQADPDVLPTLLAYKDGKLQKTWIRVDWEIKDDGVEGLLKRAKILSDRRDHGLGRDVEDDE